MILAKPVPLHGGTENQKSMAWAATNAAATRGSTVLARAPEMYPLQASTMGAEAAAAAISATRALVSVTFIESMVSTPARVRDAINPHVEMTTLTPIASAGMPSRIECGGATTVTRLWYSSYRVRQHA